MLLTIYDQMPVLWRHMPP